ncbi:hypothetical protein Tco_0028174 [Tanacetum coccineum]
MMTLHQYTCGALGALQPLLLLLGGLLLPHRSPGTGMIFRGRVRNFELSSVLLHFAMTESLKLPEVSLFRRLGELSSFLDLRPPLALEEKTWQPASFRRICDSVHESGDSHALRCSFSISNFRLIPLYEVFCGLSVSLFDVVEHYEVSDTLFLLEVVFQECFS